MNETPRTDAIGSASLWAYWPEAWKQAVELARQLETELFAAQSRIAELEREKEHYRQLFLIADKRVVELERERVIKQTHIENLNAHITDLTTKVMELEREKANLKWWATAQAVHEEHESLTAKLAAALREA